MAFRGTYLRRLWTFIEESDSAVGHRLHRRLAKDLAAQVVKSTDNLAALTSSSNEESLDDKKCEDLAVTVVCKLEGIVTRVNCKEVLSDEDLPSEFGAPDIRQVIRRRDSPPGGPTRRTAVGLPTGAIGSSGGPCNRKMQSRKNV